MGPVWWEPVRSAALALDQWRAFIEIVDQYYALVTSGSSGSHKTL